MSKGWECPKCGMVLAPDVKEHLCATKVDELRKKFEEIEEIKKRIGDPIIDKPFRPTVEPPHGPTIWEWRWPRQAPFTAARSIATDHTTPYQLWN